MSILAVTSSKPRAESKLGFNCKVLKESVVVTSVDCHGLFAGTDLQKGQEILRINGSSMQNMRTDKMVALLRSLPKGDVTIIVKSKILTADGVIFQCKSATPGDGKLKIHGKMVKEATDMPKILKDAHVPLDKWWLIYSLVAQELMPISLKCLQSNEIYHLDMESYQRGYGRKGCATEKAAHMLGVQTSILHNNVTLVAMSIKDQINSFLSKYHIMAVLAYESIALPQYPGQKASNDMTMAVGFNFYSMDYLTVCAVSAVPAMALPETPVAAHVAPRAPALDY